MRRLAEDLPTNLWDQTLSNVSLEEWARRVGPRQIFGRQFYLPNGQVDGHHKSIRTTTLVERGFEGERRRTKVICVKNAQVELKHGKKTIYLLPSVIKRRSTLMNLFGCRALPPIKCDKGLLASLERRTFLDSKKRQIPKQ